MGVFDFSDQRFLAVNRCACGQYGHSEDEFLSLTLRDLTGESDYKRLDQVLELTKNQGNSGPPSTWIHRTKAGARLTVELTTNVIESGDYHRGVAMLRDVTEMQRSIESLRRSERNMAEAQRMTHLGSWTYDTGIGEFTLSDEFFRIAGYESGGFEPTWENIRACVYPDDRPKIDHGVILCVGEWGPEPLAFRIQRPDGKIRCVLSCAEVIYDEDGATSVVRGTIQDVTEHRDAECQLERAYEETLEGWARALDLRDHETEGHSRRVTELALGLAMQLGLSQVALTHIRRGSLLHDIGKVGISDTILLKPGPLKDDERAIMQKHTTYGREILSPIEFLGPALEIPYYHHERWDGTGYPLGLRGSDIPLSARLFALADVWDALTSDRPYRGAWPVDQARAYIQAQAGHQFDPELVPMFLDLVAD